MKRNNREVGNQAEDLACIYLEKKGFKICERNFSCRSGEIDIIGLDQGDLVFVEVKYRKNNAYGLPREAVNYYKQRNITKVASYYLLIKKATERSCRFDVVEIIGRDIVHLENAFGPVY